MFDSIRSHRRWLMFFLLVLVFPSFVVTGIYGYNRFVENEQGVARVAGQSILPQELDGAHRQRLEELRQRFGANFDPALFDTKEMRAGTLDALIAQRTLLAEAAAEHMVVTDQQLKEVIASIPAFQQDGKFSYERYRMLLQSQGRTEATFERDVRNELIRQSLLQSVSSSALVPVAVVERLQRLAEERREVRELRLQPQEFAAKVVVSDEAIRSFYESNRASFETPESVKAQYLILTLDDVAARITVPEADLRAYFEQNKGRYGEDEQRRASHILLTAGADGTAPDKAGARKKAEEILVRVRANPREFERLAREFSKDPGSAANGGDLGFFGRNMMVKPFEEAAYRLKEGEISPIVETDFGFHIIRVTGIKGAQVKPFELVRADLEREVRRQEAQKKFAEAAEQFTNAVYEQADSLAPAAEKLKLQVQTIDSLTRAGLPARPNSPQVFTPRLVSALFADDALRNKRNTEAVEIGQNALAAARVVEYRPAAVRPLADVREQIRAQVVRKESTALAQQAAQERLAALQKSSSDAGFGAVKLVSRQQAEGLPAAAVNMVMRVPADQLPAYVLGEVDGGTQVIFRVLSVRPAERVDAQQTQQLRSAIGQQFGAADDEAFMAALKAKFKAEVLQADLRRNPPAVDKKQNK